MNEYKFVKIEISNWSKKPKEEYQGIINKHTNIG